MITVKRTCSVADTAKRTLSPAKPTDRHQHQLSCLGGQVANVHVCQILEKYFDGHLTISSRIYKGKVHMGLKDVYTLRWDIYTLQPPPLSLVHEVLI